MKFKGILPAGASVPGDAGSVRLRASPAAFGAGRATVAFVQRHLNHFRVPYFEGLRSALARDGIALRLLVGTATADEKAKRDAAHLPWAELLPTRYLFGGRAVWMPIRAGLGEGDLLIVEQANKFIWNLWELLKPRAYRFALLGHGRNMQSENSSGGKERFKRWATARADWFFAYTEVSRRALLERGFPGDRITVLNNAIDTLQMLADRASLRDEELRALARQLGLAGKPVGLFLGSMYSHKGLRFAMQAACEVRRRLPDFQWLVIGDGPDRAFVDAMASEHPWVHYVGARTGREKLLYGSLCDILMLPGAIGLVVLDSFVLGKPIVTIDGNYHGPEIAYLSSGNDAVLAAEGLDAYVEAVTSLLLDRTRLARMQRNCLAKARLYTIEAMVERTRQGVLQALRAPASR